MPPAKPDTTNAAERGEDAWFGLRLSGNTFAQHEQGVQIGRSSSGLTASIASKQLTHVNLTVTYFFATFSSGAAAR